MRRRFQGCYGMESLHEINGRFDFAVENGRFERRSQQYTLVGGEV